MFASYNWQVKFKRPLGLRLIEYVHQPLDVCVCFNHYNNNCHSGFYVYQVPSYQGLTHFWSFSKLTLNAAPHRRFSSKYLVYGTGQSASDMPALPSGIYPIRRRSCGNSTPGALPGTHDPAHQALVVCRRWSGARKTSCLKSHAVLLIVAPRMRDCV